MKEKNYVIKLTKEQMQLLNISLKRIILIGQNIIYDNNFNNFSEMEKFINSQNKVINLGANVLKQKIEQDGIL